MPRRVVVEWTRSSLRMAVSEGSRESLRLRALRVEPLGAGVDPAKVLADSLKQLRGRAGKAVAIIPRDQAIVRLMKFPTVQPVELRRMVELSGKAQLPYPKEQVVVDFQLLEQRDGSSLVSVVACRRDVIERHLAPLRAAGLEIGCVTVSSWGVLGWYAQAARAVKAPEPVLVINRDAERTDIVLVRDGRLLLSRSVTSGGREPLPDAAASDFLTGELDRSLASVRKELPGTEVRSFLLTGVGPLQPVQEQIAQRFSIPVKTLDPNQPFAGRVPFAHPSVSPVVVSGAAGAPLRSLLNLTLPELVHQVRHTRQIRTLAVVGGVVLVALGLAGGLAAQQVMRQQQIAEQMDQVIETLEPKTRQVQKKKRATQLVASALSHRRHLGELLEGIVRMVPSPVELEALTFEHGKRQLVLRGRAPSTTQVLGYLAMLEQLDRVAGVRLKHSTRRETASGERMDFELVIQQERL